MNSSVVSYRLVLVKMYVVYVEDGGSVEMIFSWDSML